jgi:hypothetical protein
MLGQLEMSAPIATLVVGTGPCVGGERGREKEKRRKGEKEKRRKGGSSPGIDQFWVKLYH